ncbi:hypothetical protein KSP39_PZI021899 [Platanthera zijinensis]|uniref:Uncharacterized protein n=1 Tax=Platanthera zijinensis TaxID=2320716 RepID=A0AAP0AYQ4_9ASPA
MTPLRAFGFLLARGRGRLFLFRSLDLLPSQGLFYTHGKLVAQSSKHYSGFSRELDPWKCCFTPSYLGVIEGLKALVMVNFSVLHHRPFSSASTSTKRNPYFSTVSLDDVRHFVDILGHKSVIQDEDRLLAANIDWMRKYKGSSQLLLLPKNTEEPCTFIQIEEGKIGQVIISSCTRRKKATMPCTNYNYQVVIMMPEGTPEEVNKMSPAAPWRTKRPETRGAARKAEWRRPPEEECCGRETP